MEISEFNDWYQATKAQEANNRIILSSTIAKFNQGVTKEAQKEFRKYQDEMSLLLCVNPYAPDLALIKKSEERRRKAKVKLSHGHRKDHINQVKT